MTAGACHSRLRSPSDLWHSSVSLVTKEELSVSTRQTRDNKATKNRSMIIISLQGKGWRSTKILVGNFPRQLNFPLLYELQYQIVVQIGAQRKCLGEEIFCPRAGGNFFHMRGKPSAHRAFPILAFTHSHSTKLVEILSSLTSVGPFTLSYCKLSFTCEVEAICPTKLKPCEQSSQVPSTLMLLRCSRSNSFSGLYCCYCGSRGATTMSGF